MFLIKIGGLRKIFLWVYLKFAFVFDVFGLVTVEVNVLMYMIAIVNS